MFNFKNKLTISFFILFLFLTFLGCQKEEENNKNYCENPPKKEMALKIPQDEAPHREIAEWWYYTGHFFTKTENKPYHFELVFFQVKDDLSPTGWGRFGHFAITDETNKTFHYEERLEIDWFEEQDEGFNLNLDGWEMVGKNGRDRIIAEMKDFKVDFNLLSTKPVVYEHGNGFVEYPFGGFTYYYSFTRMNLNGLFTLNEIEQEVTGEAWFDHQWGPLANVADRGWDWFSIQLDDNSEIMLFIIHNTEKVLLASGTYVSPECEAIELLPEDFEYKSTKTWKSPKTNTEYPNEWTVKIIPYDIELNVVPIIPEQELESLVAPTYWEGAVKTTGTKNNEPIKGHGYVELTGYTPWEHPDS